MKEQEKITVKEQHKVEKSSIPDNKFRVIVIKILTGLKKGVNKLSENFNKEKI